ncbi:hypothetical protein ACTFIU_011106 [Dictyostelium citrinum]
MNSNYTTFTYNSNEPIVSGTIPNVHILKLGNEFNQPIDLKYLPSVTELSFGENYTHSIANCIPKTVKTLNLSRCFKGVIQAGDIPNTVTKLTFGTGNADQKLEEGIIPTSVTDFTFSGVFVESQGNEWSDPVEVPVGFIPKSVVSLKFDNWFNSDIAVGSIPQSVVDLSFGYHFRQTLKVGTIPQGVKNVSFGYCYCAPISAGVFPNGIKNIKFDCLYDKPFEAGVIPRSTETLTLNQRYTLSTSNVPTNTKIIKE